MSKIPVLKIGYMAFAVSPKANISAVLTALQNAQRVDYDYVKGEGMVYFPQYDDTTISVEYVDQRQLRPSDPRKEAKAAPSQATLTGGNLLPDSNHAARR